MLSEWSTFALCTLGSLIYSLGFVSLTIPYHFPDSGVMGIALLLKYTIGLSPALVNLIGNVILMAWGGRELSKRFVAWTAYNIVVMSVFIELLPRFMSFPHIADMFLVAIAGGIVKGIGCGMIYRTGASAGGTDIVVFYLRKKLGIEVGKYSFYLNMFILAASIGIVGIDRMLYGLVASFVLGQTTDSVLSSFDKRRLVFIVVSNPKAVVEYICDELHRGATLLHSEGSFSGEERETIMSLLTPRQAMVLKRYLARNYPNAFMVVSEASEVVGNGFKRWKNI